MSFDAPAVCAEESAPAPPLPGIKLTLLDRNQFWFVLPTGTLPGEGEERGSLAAMHYPANRHAVLLVRTVFMSNTVVTIEGTGKRVLLDFQPCVLVGRNKEGKAVARLNDELRLSNNPAPGEPDIPDVGDLLSGLQETTKSLETVDALLADPDALTSQDPQKRHELKQKIAATKDRVLIGLSGLGDILTQSANQSREEWLAGISASVSTTIEAIVSFNDFADHIRNDKVREMEALKLSIERYFSKIDPNIDAEACKKFSRGINTMILDGHKGALNQKIDHLQSEIEKQYEHIIITLQQAMAKGSSLSFLPRPFSGTSQGSYTSIVFNMVHIVMAVQKGSLSIRLETEKNRRLYNDCKAWDEISPPRVHIVDQKRYDAMLTRLKRRRTDDF